ncbi:AraC family transcriptional regulator [Pseudomonas sp. H9]|uniref:helix-turn-helix transcriptional regulator n=1 Tax=Pseudomonas sp. H9 TaxID=483968 RepID=UPI0014044C37|nr:AraC family transcriptional regulator [Pseudomonas sp. H9]
MLSGNHWPTNTFPEHRNRPSLSASNLICGVLALESLGVDLEQLQSQWGTRLSYLRQPNLRVPAFVARRFWEVARALSGDPAIGVVAARHIDPGQMLGVAYLMQLMPSRQASLGVLAQYWPLLAGHLELNFDEREGHLCVALMPAQTMQPATEEIDFWAAQQVLHLKGMPGTTNAIRMLRLRRSEPENPGPWLALAVGSVQFGAERDEAVVDMTAVKEQRAPGSQAVGKALQAALRNYAKQTLQASVLESVASEVLQHLHERPDLEQTAQALHMTSRTLHRALQREGWSFNSIVEVHRRYLARDLIQARVLSISEVAGRLGYQEVSNFIRAFRRWYGVNPGAYQQR